MGGKTKEPTPWAHNLGQDVLLLSYFTYPKGSSIGKMLAFLSLSPLALIFALLGAFICTQQVWYLILIIGQLSSTLFNEVIKHIIKQPRPVGSTRGGYGMPSDHSQMMMFFAANMTNMLYLDCWQWPVWLRQTLSGVCFLWAVLVMWSRHMMKVHSFAQVCAGASCGIPLGCLFYQLLKVLPIADFQRILDGLIGEVLARPQLFSVDVDPPQMA